MFRGCTVAMCVGITQSMSHLAIPNIGIISEHFADAFFGLVRPAASQMVSRQIGGQCRSKLDHGDADILRNARTDCPYGGGRILAIRSKVKRSNDR